MNKRFLVVSLHEKDSILRRVIPASLFVVEGFTGFDTDSLGTFAGEVDRKLGPMEAAEAKALQGFGALKGYDAYLASEGSFNPHPEAPFLTLGVEVLVAYFPEKDRWIRVQAEGVIQHAFSERLKNLLAAEEWIENHDFGVCSLILKDSRIASINRKGIKTAETFLTAFKELQEITDGALVVESDFRAHQHKERQVLLEKAGFQLIERIQRHCLGCGEFGFGEEEWVRGLPCAWCEQPTRLVKARIRRCSCCGYQETESMGEAADPGRCDRCNP